MHLCSVSHCILCNNRLYTRRQQLSDTLSLTAKAPAREDTVQTNFLPHKSFPEKSPVNGTSEQPPKTLTNTGAPPVSSYNRYTPKPYTTSAKPFARMFDSPKFNHNLLPNDKPEIAPKVR